jgi:hypothetical protein
MLELILRSFGLSGNTIPTSIVNGDLVNKPYAEGIYIKGGLAEIKGHYVFNSQGFNSLKDYSKLTDNKIRVAIIGDSFIEGLQVDVEKSIGRLLEEQMKSIEVHEYGRSGSNIVDYGLIYKKYIKGKYDYVFVYLTDKDLIEKLPENMGKLESLTKMSFGRIVYKNSYLIRYLNINHGLTSKLKDVMNKDFSISLKKKSIFSEKEFFEKVNYQALSLLDSSVIVLYESEKLKQFVKRPFRLKKLQITHKKLPKDFGFDVHWNLNGRMNCAESIKNYINDDKK